MAGIAVDQKKSFEFNQREADQEEKVFFLNIVEIWASIYRSRWWIISIFLGCFVTAVAYTILAPRYYESTSTIEVKQEAEKVLGTEADREGMASKMDGDRFLQTQLDIIRSWSTANAVAESLHLYRGDVFLKAMRASAYDQGQGVLSTEEAKRALVIKILRKQLSVGYTGDTRLANISFSAPDPRLSVQIANAYTDNFIRGNLVRKLESSSYALEFLRSQLSESQVRLEQSEQAAVDYARRQRIVDASNAAGDGLRAQPQSLVTAQLVQLNTALAEAKADRIGTSQKWQETEALPLMNIPEVLANQAIQNMVQKRAEADSHYREQLATRQADYPTVIEARNMVAAFDSQIGSLARSIRGSIYNQYKIARAKEYQILDAVNGLKSDTLTEQNQSIQLSILRREAETNRAQYDALMKRFNEINAESGVQTNNLAIVDRAQVPTLPSWPRLPVSLLIAAAFATIFSALLVILRAQIFDAIRTPADVQERLALPLLGTVPDDPDFILALQDSKSTTSEAFGTIRTSLSLSSEHGAPKTLMVTSAQKGEGKSSTCNALALSFARLGKRVIIVDVDLRRPNAHRLFDLDNNIGLSHYLSGQTQLENIIRSTSYPNVELVSVGDTPPNPTEQLSSPLFGVMVERFIRDYDMVLFDSAPVLGLADAVIVGNHVEGVLFVIEANRNTVRGAIAAVGRLTHGNCIIAGVILTKFSPARFGYGEQHSYGYEYEYSSKNG